MFNGSIYSPKFSFKMLTETNSHYQYCYFILYHYYYFAKNFEDLKPYKMAVLT